MRVSERAKAAERGTTGAQRDDDDDWIRDGCDGSWNRDRGRRGSVGGSKVRSVSRAGEDRWWHTERERGRGKREGRDVGVDSFF